MAVEIMGGPARKPTIEYYQVLKGVTWTQYRRGDREDKYYPLFTTKVNGIIYDVSSQGCSEEKMKKVLQTFIQAPKKKIGESGGTDSSAFFPTLVVIIRNRLLS
jgi:hypothetical protein